MRRIFLSVIIAVVSVPLNAQLDPFFFGSYVNADSSKSITVYTMDEVVDDCFIVEMDNIKESEHWEGYGHCNGEEGRMELLFERTASVTIPVEFGILANGLKSLTLFYPGENSEVFLEKNE
ncbi:MAG: hypothetical protein RIT43_1480 [Bacteroidota bacterium]|jgi:hypothetical protein